MNAQLERFRALMAALADQPPLHGATCTEIGGDIWFPQVGDSGEEFQTIIRLCRECPVRRACLQVALDSPDGITHFGVWAGYTRRRLRRMRQLRKALARAPKITVLPVHTERGTINEAA